MERLRQIDPTLRISNLTDRHPIRRPADLARLAHGLRIAGLRDVITTVPTLVEEIQLVKILGEIFLALTVIKQAIYRCFLEQGKTENL